MRKTERFFLSALSLLALLYDVIDPGAFFCMLGFRHPAVFFPTRHPFRFLEEGLVKLDFLYAWVLEAAAKETVDPATNIRPARSVIRALNIRGIMVQSVCLFLAVTCLAAGVIN